MKAKAIIMVVVMMMTGFMSSGQNIKALPLDGSWMGKISTKDFSMLVLLRFESKKGKIKGYLDLPDKSIKDIVLDRVWVERDSLFADGKNALGWPADAPLIYKGRIVAGDSVIDGAWSGNLPLKLRRTNYVFELKTNLKPELAGYKIVKLIESTPLKDQQLTGDCWSFATTSFIETEAIRKGKKQVVLSPMFFVRPTYIEKAETYIRRNGTSFFSEGDLTFSVMKAYKEFGAIPEAVYSGKRDSVSKHDHWEMNAALLEKVKYYVKSGRGNMSAAVYRKEFDDILSATLGKVPETFVYEGKEFTPKTFAKKMIGIDPDDYVEITSYSHHQFYSRFALEIEANWNGNRYLNLPLDDFAAVIDNALLNNYSVCWDGDNYEGFNDGMAVLPERRIITQEVRQAAFDNRTTDDVHNMHIVGIVANAKGERFYVIKNSSDARNCGGYMYMSREYLLLKTISVMVNKNAVMGEIWRKVRG